MLHLLFERRDAEAAALIFETDPSNFSISIFWQNLLGINYYQVQSCSYIKEIKLPYFLVDGNRELFLKIGGFHPHTIRMDIETRVFVESLCSMILMQSPCLDLE